MKKMALLLCGLALILCLLSSVALAESWTCPKCNTVNTGNYCSNCGEKKPAAASVSSSAISDVRFTPQSNGDVMVKWNDSARSGPYTIEYTTSDWQQNWYEQDTYGSTQATLVYMIPGVTYDVTIASDSATTTEEYTVPRPIYTEFVTGGKYLTLTETRFSLSDMDKNPTQTFQVRVSWPKLKKSREYTAKLVLKTPYGYSGTVRHWDSFTFENKYSYTYMTYSLMSEWLQNVEEDFGSIPTGEYTFEIYMDGQLYDCASFFLNN